MVTPIQKVTPSGSECRFLVINTDGGEQYALYSETSEESSAQLFAFWVVVPQKATSVFSLLYAMLEELFPDLKELEMGEEIHVDGYAKARYEVITYGEHSSDMLSELAYTISLLLPHLRRAIYIVEQTRIVAEQ